MRVNDCGLKPAASAEARLQADAGDGCAPLQPEGRLLPRTRSHSVDEGRATLLAAAVAVAGTLLLLLFSSTPQKVGVAQALLSEEGAYVQLSGSASNATAGKFLVCEGKLCISVRADDAPLSHLVYEGRWVTATGRIQVYMKNRYIEAERVEIR